MWNKIRAYTLIEVVLVMAISLIITSAVYLGVQLLDNKWSHIRNENQFAYQLSEFLSNIKSDAFYADEIFIENEQLHFYFKQHTVDYRFTDTEAVRKMRTNMIEMSDTLNFSNVQMKGFWNSNKRSAGLVDKVDIFIRLDSDTLTIHLNKSYSVEQLLNYRHANSN